MGSQPRREGTPPRTALFKELSALPQREVFHPQGIDRNPFPPNSQRICRSRDLSGSNGACAGALPHVSGGGGDDPMGGLPAFGQDGGGEV